MIRTPKSLRIQIGLFGRTNVGKSSFLNFVAGQDVAITSPIAGTTTDVVEKCMELLPVGPVVFLDTAGLDDVSDLAALRIKKTKKIFDRSDVIVLITEADAWTGFEEEVLFEAKKREIPVIIVINKIDLKKPSSGFLEKLNKLSNYVIQCNSLKASERDEVVVVFKKYLLTTCPDGLHNPSKLIGDLVCSGSIVILIVPIDLEAPKGRIILPQVQVIRDLLDHRACALVVKESEYLDILSKLKDLPDLVVCDSQVVHKMVKETPVKVKCTTFSILFSKYRGDLLETVKGLSAIGSLKDGDKVLIAEACSHHAIEDDIGRVKIPKWLKNFTGANLIFEVCSGIDYPEDLRKYALIVHCGGCMINRMEMLSRIQRAKEQKVPITNYGLAIAKANGVLERVLSPFPEVLKFAAKANK